MIDGCRAEETTLPDLVVASFIATNSLVSGASGFALGLMGSTIDLAQRSLEMVMRQAVRPLLFQQALLESALPPLESVVGSCYEVAGVTHAKVKDFSVHSGDPDPIPTLILPPRAFHGPEICNAFFDPSGGQSQIAWAREAGIRNIYAAWWQDSTLSDADRRLSDLADSIGDLMEHIRHKDYGGRDVTFNVIGECALGYPLINYILKSRSEGKDEFRGVVIAGAPLDPQAGESKIKFWVNFNNSYHPQIYDLMSAPVVHGRLGLMGFKMLNFADRYYGDYVGLWNATYDPTAPLGVKPNRLAAAINFRRWYETVIDLEPATFKEGIVPYFSESPLRDGCQVMDGTSYPLSLIGPPIEMIELGGANDDITDCRDLFAFSDHYSYPLPPTGYTMVGDTFEVTPLSSFRSSVNTETLSRQVVQGVLSGGHIGLFMSRGAREYYDIIFRHWNLRNDALRNDDLLRSYH